MAYVCAENGHVSSVLIATNSGLERIEGKVFIDCTGDGSVAAMAGAEYELSEELQLASLSSILANVRPAKKDFGAVHADFMRRVDAGTTSGAAIPTISAGPRASGGAMN